MERYGAPLNTVRQTSILQTTTIWSRTGNVRTSAPLAKSSNLDKIPVYLRSGADVPAGTYEVAVMTVKEEVADDVFDMLLLVKPEQFTAHSIKKRRVAREDADTVTLFAVLKPSPFYLSIR